MAKRPLRRLNDQELDLLEKYSAIRLPMDQICHLLEISETQLVALKKKDDKVRRAIHQGRAKASSEVRRTLFTMATKDKDFQALKFWCQTQEGFKTADKIELSGPDGGPMEQTQVSKEELKARLIALRKANDLTEDE